MKAIIILNQAIKSNTVAYGTAVGIVDKEYFSAIINSLKQELAFTIRKNGRK